MPIVPSQSTLHAIADYPAVPLSYYSHVIGVPECQFWGVRPPDDEFESMECSEIWAKPQRDMIEYYLTEAQEEIEREARYFLTRKWVQGTPSADGHDERTDEQVWKSPLIARWTRVLEPGIRAVATIELAATVDYATEPATIGPIVISGISDTSEIAVYHPGTDVEIDPSAVTIAGGNLTIRIPRCRLVAAEYADNPDTGIDYNDLDYFEETVDVKRVYNDPSTQAVFVSAHECDVYCAACGCSDYTQAGCIRVLHSKTGVLSAAPGNYSDGDWTLIGCNAPYYKVRLNYRAGMYPTTKQARDAVIRLAHAKMPEEPCGCDISQRLWKRDRDVPKVLSVERLNCPFGLNDGAWIAYRFARSMRVQRSNVI